MKNYVARGVNIKATLDTAVASGEGVVIGDLFAVAMNDYAANTEGVYLLSGIVSLPKKTGDSLTAAGTKVYWDAATKSVTTAAGSAPAAAAQAPGCGPCPHRAGRSRPSGQ